MAKVYNITDKLEFAQNPKIKIKNQELEVHSEATTVLKVMGEIDKAENNFDASGKVFGLLFSDADQKKIEKMKLNAADYIKLMEVAVQLAIGKDPDESKGEE